MQRERAPYREPRFLGYTFARGLSLVGDNVWWIAVGWSAAHLGDPGLTGIVLAAAGVPRVALMLLGGVLADLRGSRRIMLTADVLAAAVALSGAFLTSGSATASAWLLIALAIVFGTIDAFYLPAANSYLASLLPPHQLPKGAAIRQFTKSVAEAGGRGLGGILVAVGGFSLAAYVNAATFLGCFGILLLVRPRFPAEPASGRPGVRQALGEGLRYVAGHPLIRGLALVTLVLNTVAIPMETVGLALKAQDLHWGAAGYGLAAGFLGGGLIAGGLLGTVMKTPARPGLALALWLVAALPGFAGLVLSTDLSVVCASVALWSLCLGPSNAILSGLLLTATRRDVLARVQSVVSVLSSAMTPLGTAAFGILVGVTSLTTVGAICLVSLVATAIWMLATPAISRAELPRRSDAAIPASR
ncbi:MFS transporter [Actinopolymorpha pittospori]|uniref:MFS family permease n=1 Tax=Actinopolymorpha pittospori TaxID=648752 RepID=A0A927N6D7_9ACTN|nr:MFS family permease [Actinopolymorpha pittospori]